MRKLKLLVLLAAAATALAVVPAIASADETVTVCGGSSDCTGTWVNHNVAVTFTPSENQGPPVSTSGCDPVTVSSEGNSGAAGHTITCTATYADATQAVGTAVVQIDRTAPNSPQTTPSAAPNAAGWFTSPFSVAFFFSGGGLSPPDPSCQGSVGYSGPDDATASVTKACTDQAGNTGSGAFGFKYDATGPTGVTAALPAPDRGNWHNHPFTVAFTGADSVSGPVACTTATYAGPDSASTTIPGSCTNQARLTTPGATAAFAYDDTPPNITGTPADRGPDHNGWYTHPVTFNFQGSDALSGIAACSHLTYGGPDDSTASLKGSCTDGAGNVTNKTISFKYDATPPDRAKLFVIPANKSIDISWAPPSDGATFSLTRTPATGGGAATLIYTGGAHDFVDSGLLNGAKYNYLLTVFDAAGNASAPTGISGVPDGSTLRPFLDTAVNHPPLLRWQKVRKARYYNVQLFRGRTKLLSIWPKGAHLRLKSKWKFNGHRYRLTPGLYRWYVWPGIGATSKHRYGAMVGSSTFRVTK